MIKGIDKKRVRKLILMALKEDIGPGDITSKAIFGKSDISRAVIKSKDNGVLCGIEMVLYVYSLIDRRVSVSAIPHDGDKIREGTIVCEMTGPTISLLSGERTVLNFIQRMSGIATRTSNIVSILGVPRIKILDTRKTLPGFRYLDKYSVKTGGGSNHRMGLYDMMLIKDNHIKAAGGVGASIERVRKKHGDKYKIEVEAKTLDQVLEAVDSGVDIIMLDNMDMETMSKATGIISKRALIEVSGNVDEERIKELSVLEIDYISIGALTHSVRAFDFSMEFL
ncbi:MAG: carboxylating nicotinate-nucleotide diphosphorylase [Spirochaetes bacterium]|jgi:nicotinate-nucleotide pyrophosphorylase (carboxylating)|nr:carboxylating nicotinate-nucleotide diphosphorylase [Spirochaetota bacterium]